MRTLLTLAACLFAAAVAASTADAQPTTAACRASGQKVVDYQACADAAPAGSPEQRWAQINLGTQAVLRDDFAKAAAFYDAAAAGGKKVYSDAGFHAFRALAYSKVGRAQEALADAKLAFAILHHGEGVPPDALRSAREKAVDRGVVYSIITPILREAKAPEAAAALAAYLAIPVEGNWRALANRASMLSDAGDYPAAIVANERAMALMPDHVALLNNHCDLMKLAGRAAEGLPFCERAIKADPQMAEVRHTHAAVLAALGRCEESRDAMAQMRRLAPSGEPRRADPACSPRPF